MNLVKCWVFLLVWYWAFHCNLKIFLHRTVVS